MLTFNFDLGPLANIDAAQEKMIRGLPHVMQEVGVYVLQREKFNFEKKSRGGVGDDGVKWRPLAESTERAKYRKGQNRPKKKKGKTVRRAPLIGPVPRSQIGVDRGLLRNSQRPGYAGPDGKGGNVLTVNGNRVTVGYGRSYAKWFDAVRPLLPTTLPTAWQVGIDEIGQEWVDDIAKELGLSR